MPKGNGYNPPVPSKLYSKIYSMISDGFMSENDETRKGKDIVNKTGKVPVYERDRG